MMYYFKDIKTNEFFEIPDSFLFIEEYPNPENLIEISEEEFKEGY